MEPEVEDPEVNPFAGLNVISIAYDVNSSDPPEVHLGAANPWFAASLLREVVKALELTLPYPRISIGTDDSLFFDPYQQEEG